MSSLLVGSDVMNIIDSYTPIGTMISDDTTKEQVLGLLKQRSELWDDKPKYLWFPMKLVDTSQFFIRVTIACNEYITEVSKIWISKKKLYGTWNCNENTEIREKHDIPIYKGIMSYNMIYDSDRSVSIYGNGEAKIYEVLPDQRHVYIASVTKDQWFSFLDGNPVPEVEKYITRRQFLDTKIIETILDGIHNTDYMKEYFQILRIFEVLYNMGYWTYGGFVNYNVIYPRYNKITAITMDGGNLRFKLDIDGTITDVKVTDDSYLSIIDDLVKLGARVA